MKKKVSIILCGIAAGAVNGLFGAGGGMVLVPLLDLVTELNEQEVFPASVCIIAPICMVSLIVSWRAGVTPWELVIPYLIASAVGGIVAGILARKIPTVWLHRTLGLLILWGGIRYLC